MRRLAVVLAAALALLLVPSVGAQAADPGEWFGPHSGTQQGRSSCVTKVEERQLVGMTRAQVRDLLGWDGYAADLYDGARDYRPCGWSWRHGRVTVRYGKAGRVWYPTRLIAPGGILTLPTQHPDALEREH